MNHDARTPGLPRLVGEASLNLGYLHTHWSHRLERLRRIASREARFDFEVLSVRVSGSSSPDWHADPVSGVRWPMRFHTSYSYGDILDRGRPSDIKIPWELSRLQCLPRLALSFRLAEDARMLETIEVIVRDWRRANPTGYGPNWTVAMEASLRAISLILTREFLVGTGRDHELADERWYELLAEHGRFIYRNIEGSDVSGNHLTSCLLGLLYLGRWASHDRESPAWLDCAVERLHDEIDAQVYPDGVCHEGSIPYHGFVAELFLHALLVGDRTGIDFSPSYRDRLYRMLLFARAYLKPDGSVPVWGDTDDGRVLALAGSLGEHHRSLLALGAVLLKREDLWSRDEPVPPAAAVLLQTDELSDLTGNVVDAAGQGPAPGAIDADRGSRTSVVGFPDGGFFMIRDGDDYCLIDCGDVGLRGRGGHGHNDALSVELTLNGRNVLVDTGCASYNRSSEERARCLSARGHNAAVVDGLEPAPIDLARIPHASACPVELVEFAPEDGRFVGRHHGYRNLGIQGYERRVELCGDSSAVFVDGLQGTGQHSVRWHLHLDGDWRDGRIGGGFAAFESATHEALALKIEWSPDAMRARLTRSPIYLSYGNGSTRSCLVIEANVELPATAEIRFGVTLSPGS